LIPRFCSRRRSLVSTLSSSQQPPRSPLFHHQPLPSSRNPPGRMESFIHPAATSLLTGIRSVRMEVPGRKPTMYRCWLNQHHMLLLEEYPSMRSNTPRTAANLSDLWLFNIALCTIRVDNSDLRQPDIGTEIERISIQDRYAVCWLVNTSTLIGFGSSENLTMLCTPFRRLVLPSTGETFIGASSYHVKLKALTPYLYPVQITPPIDRTRTNSARLTRKSSLYIPFRCTGPNSITSDYK
jgi:hypothetical protein